MAGPSFLFPAVSPQTLGLLTAQVDDINASTDKISKALTTIVLGIISNSYENSSDVQNAINEGDITKDTYIAFIPAPFNAVVDTAENIIKKYPILS